MMTRPPEIKQKLLAHLLKKRRGNGLPLSAITKTPRREGANHFPLSFAQKRLLFLSGFSKENASIYNTHVAYRITGALDKNTLEQALNALIARHEIMRTRFQWQGAPPLQIVASHLSVPLTVRAVKNISRKKAIRVIHEDMLALLNAPFSLDSLPLFRVKLYHISRREHVLCFVIHHIINDGWSIGILMRDLVAAYNNLKENLPAFPDELPIQYGDYAVWEQEHYSDQAILEPKLRFWKSQLGDEHIYLNLPLDYTRPRILSHQGEMQLVDIPPTLVKALKAFAVKENGTLFHVLMAAYIALLHRYSNQESINVGIPVANRRKKEIENVIGCFINTAVVSCREIDDEMPFHAFLQKVKSICVDVMSHQDLQFEKLIEELNPPRDTARTPLFQTSFNYFPISPLALQSPELTIEGLLFNRKTALCDLAFNIWEEGDTLIVKLEYMTALFSPSTIRRFADHYANVLREIVRRPEQKIGSIRFLSKAEYHRHVHEWNRRSRTCVFPEISVIDVFRKNARAYPDHTALEYDGRELTYRELESRARKLAGYLVANGVREEEKIALVMDSSLEIVIGILGILMARAAYVPIEPKNPAGRMEYIIQNAKARFVLTQRELESIIPAGAQAKKLVIDPDVTAIPESTEYAPERIKPESLMYVLFTSGSTGVPKGVEIEHRCYGYYLQALFHDLGIKHQKNFVIATSFAADLGTTNLWGALCTGGTLHIVPHEKAIDPRCFAAYLKKNVINVFKLTPSFFKALKACTNLKDILPTDHLILAGEALDWETVKEIHESGHGCLVENHYGPTEITVAAVHFPCNTDCAASTGTVPIGKPFSNRKVYVLSKNLEITPVGVPGELYIGGQGLARGYCGHPELTKSRFIPSPFSDQENERLYKTGDLVRYLPDGNIEFLGRTDFQVKIKGYRIELEEIEQKMRLHPAVASAAVCVRKGANSQERLIACFDVIDTGSIPSQNEMKSFLKDILPEYMIPTHFLHLEKLPLTSNGKIDRARLIKEMPEAVVIEPKADFEEPQNALEKEIATAWEETLQIKGIGRNENFFDIGGESLTAMWLMQKIAPHVSVIELFKHPTIHELAEFLSDHGKTEDGILCELTDLVHGSQPCTALVCIPQGGADIITFSFLAKALNGSCRVLAAKIPGHSIGKRGENLEPLKSVAQKIVRELEGEKGAPIAIYAHCVGGALGIEIARLLEKENHHVVRVFQAANFPTPRLLGKGAEFWKKLFRRKIFISDKAFHDMLRSMGGVEEGISGDELNHIIRCMRHDASEAEDYYTEWYGSPDKEKLKVPITCIVGGRDRMTEFYEEQYLDWKDFSRLVDLRVIEHAGHYFHKHQAETIAAIIKECATVKGDPGDVAPSLRGSRRSPETRAAADGYASRGQRVAKIENMAAARLSPAVKGKPGFATFLIVAIGQLFSMLGSRMTTFGLGIWIFGKTGSVTDLAVIGIFAMVPGILALPLAGAVADRYDKRLLMILSDTAAALGPLIIALLSWLGRLELWHIYVICAIGAIANAFQRPAYIASVAQLVPKRFLGQANGIIQFTVSTAEMIAPLLGGLMVGLIQLQGIVLIDFATFIIAVGALLAVRFPNALFKKMEEPIVKEIMGGLRFILKRQPLVIMIVFFFVFNLAFNISTTLYTPMFLTLFSQHVLGIVVACIGGGGIAGSVLMSIWGGTRKRAQGMVASAILVGASTILMGLQLWLPSIILGTFGVWLSIALINTHWLAMMQTKVGIELLGRVISINQMLAWLSLPLGYILAGALADKVFEPLVRNGHLAFVHPLIEKAPGNGIRLLLILAGIFMLVWGIIGMSIRKLRNMEDILPDIATDVLIPKEKDKTQQKADLLYEKHVARIARNQPLKG